MVPLSLGTMPGNSYAKMHEDIEALKPSLSLQLSVSSQLKVVLSQVFLLVWESNSNYTENQTEAFYEAGFLWLLLKNLRTIYPTPHTQDPWALGIRSVDPTGAESVCQQLRWKKKEGTGGEQVWPYSLQKHEESRATCSVIVLIGTPSQPMATCASRQCRWQTQAGTCVWPPVLRALIAEELTCRSTVCKCTKHQFSPWADALEQTSENH